MKLKGFEAFQAVESQPVDYEAELAKYVQEKAGTRAVDADVSEQPTQDATDGDTSGGLARLLDYIAAKQKRRQKEDKSQAGTNIVSLRVKAVEAYLRADELENQLAQLGNNLQKEA